MYDDLLGPRKPDPKKPSKKINLTSAPRANKKEEEEVSLEEALEEALEEIEDEDPWAGAGNDIDEDLDTEDKDGKCPSDDDCDCDSDGWYIIYAKISSDGGYYAWPGSMRSTKKDKEKEEEKK